jgi:hypothetical protein
VLRFTIFSFALLAFCVQPLAAACIDQAIPDLRKGTVVTILRTDGSRMKASFIRAAGDPPRLVLEERLVRSQRIPQRFEIATEDIARLDAAPKTQFHGERIGIGALAGFGIGGIVGALVPNNHSYPLIDSGFSGPGTAGGRVQAIMFGGMSGAFVGMLAGLFVSTIGGKPRSWSCDQPVPGAAAPDST